MMRGNADAVVGMMDAAYFIGRKELLDFFNDLLDLKLQKIEQTATGAIACQITDLIFPGSIPLSKIDWSAKSDYEFVQNYKLLQNAFNKHRVQRHVDVDKLIRAKYQDNLEFCQWLKAFFDQSGAIRENYDPTAARAKGKGGKQYNQLLGKSSMTSSASSRGTAQSTSSRTITSRVTTNATSTRSAVSATTKSSINNKSSAPSSPGKVGSRPLRETGNNGPILNINNRATTSTSQQQLSQQQQQQAIADAVLIKKNADLTKKSNELELAVIEIEKERDFYFEKLRNVEVMLQIYQEKDNTNRDSDILIDNVFKILYATAEDNLVVNDDGDAVVATDITLLNETGVTHNIDNDNYSDADNNDVNHNNIDLITNNDNGIGLQPISSGDGEMLESLLASEDSHDNLLTA